MKVNISDLMADMLDELDIDGIELSDPGITDADRIMALATGAPAPRARRRGKKLWRTLLIAAALTLALSAAALAVYQYSMADRTIEMFPAGTEPQVNIYGDEMENYSAVGYSDSAEYRALSEWYAFKYGNYETLDATQLLDYDDPCRYYCGYRFQADKLNEIAEEYGLRLLRRQAGVYTAEELCGLMDIAPTAFAAGEIMGYVYDDGSFQAYHLKPAGGETEITLCRAVKGTLTEFLLFGSAAEAYTLEGYETAGGTMVELALGTNDSFLFAELDGCYVTAEISGGTEPYEAGQSWQTQAPVIGMDDLKRMADSIDFAALDSFDSDKVSAAVGALYEEQSALWHTGYASPSEKARAVLAELGDYALSAIPDGYYLHSIVVFDEEDSRDTIWAASVCPGGVFAEVGVTYATYQYADDDRDSIGLRYTRYWADGDKSAVINREQFENYGMLLDSPESLGVAACQVGDFDGWYYIDKLYNFGRIQVSWLDTENDLIFDLTVPGSYTVAEAIDLAETITGQ